MVEGGGISRRSQSARWGGDGGDTAGDVKSLCEAGADVVCGGA